MSGKLILRVPTASALEAFGLPGGRPGSIDLVKHHPGDLYVTVCVIESETKQSREVLLDRDGLEQLEMAAARMRAGM